MSFVGTAAEALAGVMSPAMKLALPYIQQGVTQGLSANAINRLLGEAVGLGNLQSSVRRTNLLTVVRYLKNQTLSADYISNVRLNFLPNPARFAPATRPTSRKYTYVVRVKGLNQLTGEATVQYKSIATDEVITKQDAVNTAMDFVDAGQSAASLNFPEGVVVNVLIHPAFAPPL